jgi:hypothetical protein
LSPSEICPFATEIPEISSSRDQAWWRAALPLAWRLPYKMMAF